MAKSVNTGGIVPGVTLLKRIGYSNINTLENNNSAFFYEAGMMIDADGAYHAYHPDNKSGLDYLGNAGVPGNWWALVTNNGKPSGTPVVQKSTDPAPGFYISTTSLQDASKNATDASRYVDSESINFIVLPGGLGLSQKLGDFAIVINPATGAYEYAVYADGGPANKIGEASIALAKALGVPFSPKNGGVASGIVYIVFPNSKAGWPLTQVDIDHHASALFSGWGGIDQAKKVFPFMNWGV
ncbi:glycoside hydrolase family 75 protein [Danxiaibacter flavus]|uniref:Glycoside hydrolase family 75 protein n=1 Tax=Danxiaibacter flavus TaxID=3049108 RepID=A0ABV3ZB47_9BACT|nr:glycoside hydrolase family 75 protein [Chitinophagaceae bacterium DXS]